MGPQCLREPICCCSPEPGAHKAGDNVVLYQKGRKRQNRSLHCVSDIPGDPVIPIAENFIFLVKLPFIFPNGHGKPFLFKIGLLFFSNGCFF